MGEYRDLFAHNLRRIMERRKYPSRKIALEIGVPDSTFSRWMHGVNVPTDAYIDALALVLEVEIREFFKPIQARTIRTLRDQSDSYAQKVARKARQAEAAGLPPPEKKKRGPKPKPKGEGK